MNPPSVSDPNAGPPATSWQEPLATSAYLRRRLTPSLNDLDYLPLLDLLHTVSWLAESAGGDVFDYGCGGAPYRHLFAHCRSYVAADIVAGPGVEKVLPPSGRTEEPDGSYDIVFSSQVLEHVPDPAQYLAEAFRILRPGGRLMLTTHGMFLEHGCPDDFYRWTGYGLARTVSNAGFVLDEAVKITPGIRASVYLVHLAMETFRTRKSPFRRGVAAVARRLYGWALRPLGNRLAPILESRGRLPIDAPEPVYVGVGVLARRP